MMPLNLVTQLLGYDFDTAQRFAEGLISTMTGDKRIIKFEDVALRSSRTKRGVKLQGEFFSMQFMFLYSTDAAYMYSEHIPRPVALFYDIVHIIGSYIGLKMPEPVELAMDDASIERCISLLVKSTNPRFKELADMASRFQWKEPRYENIAGNLTIHWYCARSDNPSALKLIARFCAEYEVQEAVLLDVRKGYDHVTLICCGNDVFYAACELDFIETILADITRITFKFIIKVERGDPDVARSLDMKTYK
ncbi:MAG: hypothetical protein LBT01_04610 [Spirochaetaceae bacterium]|jgi:hypothetical protein|nr:hypothetical protein [Spirochaetaceae bacterium]